MIGGNSTSSKREGKGWGKRPDCQDGSGKGKDKREPLQPDGKSDVKERRCPADVVHQEDPIPTLKGPAFADNRGDI